MDKKLVLLSDSLDDFLRKIYFETQNEILLELLVANKDINNYNCLSNKLLKIKLDKNINDRITDYARQLTMRMDTFEISFLPKNKEPIYVTEGVWSKTNRQTGKPIRIIQKLIKKRFSNYEYEKLHNLLKSKFVDEGELIVVEGEDIRKYYDCSNNNPGGTLENSCMKHEQCQKYLDIYVDHCKMLVFLNKNTDKISGRAILWNIDGKTLMDRVYYTKDYILDMYINYAKEKRWYYRENNSLLSTGDSQYWFSPVDNYAHPENFNFSIKIGYYDYYPYIDSFRYLYLDTLYDYVPNHCDYCACDNTDGTNGFQTTYCCESCGCEEMGTENEAPDDFYWSFHDEAYYCYRCCKWCDKVDDYVNIDDLVEVNVEDSCTLDLPIWFIEGNTDYVFIDGEWYSITSNLIDFNPETREYYLKDE